MTRPDARNQERGGEQVERVAEVLAEHANDGCGDCICSEYVLDVPFPRHVAAALVANGVGVLPEAEVTEETRMSTPALDSDGTRADAEAILSEGEVEHLCEVMHDAYEAAAVEHGWETQERSRKSWADLPEANKETMRVAARTLIAAHDNTWQSRARRLADRVAQAKAEALREAAEEHDTGVVKNVYAWLRERADRIEAEQ